MGIFSACFRGATTPTTDTKNEVCPWEDQPLKVFGSPQREVDGSRPSPRLEPIQSPKKDYDNSNSVLQRPSQPVQSLFKLGRVLGRGQFGTTRKAIEIATGKPYACKSISKRKLNCKDDVEDVRREIQILHHLNGDPSIVALKGVYEDRGSVHVVMELCKGGELFDRIVAKGCYTESVAASLCRTILKVVAHCHKMGVFHRDLKPENFLLTDNTDQARIKCTDFGLSVMFERGEKFHEIVGSPYYLAPEVLHKSYGPEADIWSCGVILYILLCGVPPFTGDTELEIFENILYSSVDFSAGPWPYLSREAQHCVTIMLERDPRKRATAEEVLNHPWMKENGMASTRPLDNGIILRMQNFSKMNKLKRVVLQQIARTLSPEQIEGLRKVFEGMDKKRRGSVTFSELNAGLMAMGAPLSANELDKILGSLDTNNSGRVDYEEFLTATLNLALLEQEEVLLGAFEKLDRQGSGYITKADIRVALKGFGSSNIDQEIDDILSKVDHDNDGRIDYAEFVKMMRSGNESSFRSSSTLRYGTNLRDRIRNASSL